jgi:IS5 family transposase
MSFRNEFDGDTLVPTLTQAHEFCNQQIKKAYCDNGYRGRKRKVSDIGIELILSNDYNGLNATEKKYCKHRSVVEPEIGHMKSENRLGRNFLKGWLGDELNIAFAGAGHNIRKILAVLRQFFYILWMVILKPSLKTIA